MGKEELIELYFSGELSNKEFLELKSLLEEDPEFKNEFYEQLEIQQAIAGQKHAFLKERLKALDSKQAPKTTIQNRRWYRYAAAMVILLGIGFVIYNSQPSYDKLYVANFEPYPNVIAPTVRGESQLDSVAKAFAFYDSNQFNNAATAFYKLYQNTGEDYAFFYRSVSLMAVGETQTAITALEKHSWQQPENYQTKTHWYLGLGYLKLHDKEQAIKHFKTVVDSGRPLAEQAQEVLEKLERLE